MSNCLSFVAGISHNHLHSCAINQAFKRWWRGLHLKRGSRATMHWGNSLFASLLFVARWKRVCFWVSVCVSFVCVQLIAGRGEIRSHAGLLSCTGALHSSVHISGNVVRIREHTKGQRKITAIYVFVCSCGLTYVCARAWVCVFCAQHAEGNFLEPSWKFNKHHVVGKVGQFTSFGLRSYSEASNMAAVESCGQVTLIEQPPSTETHTHPATHTPTHPPLSWKSSRRRWWMGDEDM